ncbi:MAG: hypothetical protein ABW215_03845 [Kibdelosporangium sp.]
MSGEDHDEGAESPAEPPEHAVIARFQLSGEGFGQEGERPAVYELQTRLREAIEEAGVGEFDGNEFGGGKVVLYAYGPDADALFAVVEPILRSFPPRPADVRLRYGSADDLSAAETLVDL